MSTVNSWEDFKDIIAIAEKYYSATYIPPKIKKEIIKRECYKQHWDKEECNC